MGRVTLQTIADQVGVSRMTVSNAFSRPDQLSATLREQILAVADKLGYAGPDPAARALASGSAGTVGILLSDVLGDALTDEVAMTFLASIADELAPTGRAMTLVSAAAKEHIVPARDVAMDGALVYSCDPESSAVGWLLRRRIPLVFVDQAPAAGIASVNVDDRGGARSAAQHIVDLGHRDVGIATAGFGGEHGTLADPLSNVSAYPERQRLVGWFDALTAAGITPTVVRQHHGRPHDTGYAAGKTLLDRRRPPTAILCFSDAMARGVIDAVADAGLAVPDDVSVVGFDDNPLGRRTPPALTTVRQDVEAKGRQATAALIKALDRAGTDRAGRGRHTVLPTELVIRDSTAAPPRPKSAGSRRGRN
ncbi:MAG TPA: LacI family DNA-binding transcriptional regulator [Jatrophihabitans sp.]|nr:LacI family DNA-binding transcriptional regulator [Jatrophihabitans sp.]